MNPAACDCTDGSTSTVCTYYPVLDCNDFNETARKVSDIRATGVKTIVIGYGDVFGTSAQRALQQISLAGDFQRAGEVLAAAGSPSDPSRFQDSNPTLCSEQFFRANWKEQPRRLAAAARRSSRATPAWWPDPAGGSNVPHHPGDREGRDDVKIYPSDVWSSRASRTGPRR